MNAENLIYFDSFWVEHSPKETKKFIGNKYIITNIYRIQAKDSIMYEYFCIGFIDFMLKDKILLDYTNLLSPKYYQKNYNNLKIFSTTKKIKKLYCVICGKYRKFEKPRISHLLQETLVLLFVVSAKMKKKNYLKRKNQLRY